MTSEELRYKDKGYNADRQHRDGVTMRTGGGCKANKYNRYKLSSASSCKKIIQKLKNGQRNRECVNKNAKLTLTNPQR